MANFSDISTNLVLDASTSIRRNSTDTAFETFIPLTNSDITSLFTIRDTSITANLLAISSLDSSLSAYNMIQDTSVYAEVNQIEASLALITITTDYVDGSIAAAVDAVDTSLVTYVDAYNVIQDTSATLFVTEASLATKTAGHTSGAMLVGVPTLGDAFYNNVCRVLNMINSAGRITGGTIYDAGGATVDVSLGSGFIKATDDDLAELLSFDWDDSTGIAIAQGTKRYLGIKYNSGFPVVDIRTADTWDLDTEFSLGQVVNEYGTLHILNNPWWVSDGITNVIERFLAEGEIVRDKHIGGLIPSVPGTRNLAVTAGVLWSRLNEFPVTGIDTDADPSQTFETYWYNGIDSSWNDDDVSVYSVTEWNDITLATLQTIPNNKYANFWIYVEADDDEIAVVYPQATYVSAAGAEAEAPPTFIPLHIQEGGILIGRILFKQGVDAPVEVQSAFATQFTAAQATDHGNLAGLGDDDDHPQYTLRATYVDPSFNVRDAEITQLDASIVRIDASIATAVDAVDTSLVTYTNNTFVGLTGDASISGPLQLDGSVILQTSNDASTYWLDVDITGAIIANIIS